MVLNINIQYIHMFGTKFGQTPLFLQAKKQHRAIFRSFMGGAAADDDEGAGPPQ